MGGPPGAAGHPRCGGVRRDIEVNHSSPVGVEDEPDAQELEAYGWDDEEVHRRDGILVIPQERQPVLSPHRIRRPLREGARDGRKADFDAELREFGVDLSRTPRVLERQAPDELSHFLRDARPAGSPPGAEPPVEAKALPVPAYDRLGLDDDQHLPPARPELAQQDPESTIQGREPGAPSGLAEDGELLAERKLDEGLPTLAAEAGP